MTSWELPGAANDGFFDVYIAANVQNPTGKLTHPLTYLDPLDRDYYISKFSTKYNITEWYK